MAEEACAICGHASDDEGWLLASTGVICHDCQRKVMQSYEAMVEAIAREL